MSKKQIARAIAAIGRAMAKLEINTNSPLIHYQQELPSKLKDLRCKKQRT